MNTEIKVYYEDTDASERVYYANYLKFLERGRTDYLYNLDFTHKNILEKYKFYFVVKNCKIDYKKPAYFEDILKITTKIINISKVKILFHQQIKKNEELLVDSEILITPVFFNGKIAKIPNEMLEKFST